MLSVRVKKWIVRICLLGCIIGLGVGITLLNTGPQLFQWIYKSQLVLRPDSGSFPLWRDIPPLKARIYIFNVTNPEQVSRGAIPVVKEMGPYVYMEHHIKTKLQWNNDNGTITYHQKRLWYPVPGETAGPLSEKVTIVNPIAASIGNMAKTMPATVRFLLSPFLDAIKEELFVTKSVEEILFEGFDDPLLTAMSDLMPLIKKYVPDGAFTDRFGIFYQRNGTDYTDGVFNIFSGQSDFRTMGQVHSWNYSTNIYFPDQCGHVRGSAGEFYPPSLKKDFIEMFSNDLCRAIKFYYNGTVSPHGIHCYEYIISDMTFANGTINPENSCFNDGSHLLSGLYNTSLCRFGAPVFVSQPHFFQADPYYQTQVYGLSPNLENHGTYMRLEPNSGLPVQVAARFQLNVLIDQVSQVDMFEDVTRSFIPMVWFENLADTPPDMVLKMEVLADLQVAMSGSGWAMIGLCMAVLVTYSIKVIFKRTRQPDTEPIMNDPDANDEDGDSNVFQE